MRSAFPLKPKPDLQVAGADGLAAVLLCALSGLLEGDLDEGGEGIRQIAGGHHVHTLEKFLNLGCNDVTHEKEGEEVERGDSTQVRIGYARGKFASYGQIERKCAIDAQGRSG